MRFSKAFTLIELIIVIAILGVIATAIIILINPLGQTRKGRDSVRKSDMKNMKNILEEYYNDKGTYPTTACWSAQTSGGTPCWTIGANSFLGAQSANITSTLPQDPSFKDNGDACGGSNVSASTLSRGYAYLPVGGGTGYVLVTRLENLSDTSIQVGSLNRYTGTGGCTAFGNYQVTN